MKSTAIKVLLTALSFTIFNGYAFADKPSCFPYTIGQTLQFTHSYSLAGSLISQNGKFALGGEIKENKIYFHSFDLGTKKTISTSLPENEILGFLNISNDGKLLFYYSEDPSDSNVAIIKVIDLQNGNKITTLKKIEFHDWLSLKISPNDQWIAISDDNAKSNTELISIAQGVEKSVTIKTLPESQVLALGDNIMVTYDNNMQINFTNIHTGKKTNVELNPKFSFFNNAKFKYISKLRTAAISSDEKNFAFILRDVKNEKWGVMNIEISSLDKNYQQLAPTSYMSLNYFSDSSSIIINFFNHNNNHGSNDLAQYVWSLKENSLQLGSFRGMPEANLTEYDLWSNGSETKQLSKNVYGKIEFSKTFCADLDHTVLELSPIRRLCNPNASSNNSESTILCSNPKITELCQKPITTEIQRDWDELASPSSKSLTSEEAEILLLRFSKPGGFNPHRDLPSLIGILNSEVMMKNYFLEIQRALQGVLFASPHLYEKLLDQFPKLIKKKNKNIDSIEYCRTSKERNQLLTKATSFLKSYAAGKEKLSVYNQWTQLSPLGNLLKYLPNETWKEYADIITQSLTDQFISMHRSDFPNSMNSKIYTFIMPQISILLGKPAPHITDLSYLRRSKSITPIIFASGKIKNLRDAHVFSTELGFEYALFPSIELNSNESIGKTILNINPSWTVDGKNYQGNLTASIAKANSSIVPVDSSPNYKSMKKDGVLTGLILLGSNIGEATEKQIAEYKLYLHNNNFTFETAKPQEVSKIKNYIQSKIESSEIDYWLKESHTEGGYDSIIAIGQAGKVEIAVKRKANSQQIAEKIYLIYFSPSNNFSRGELITNQDFAKWFKERDKKPNSGQFIMINASCGTIAQTARQIEAVQSNKFLAIATENYTSGIFGIDEDYAQSPLWDGLRTEKGFQWIQDGFKEIKSKYLNDYKKYNFQFSFIFPSEEIYKKEIIDLLSTILTVKQNITEDGKPYSYQLAPNENAN